MCSSVKRATDAQIFFNSFTIMTLQIAELHARLDSETKKSDRLEFDTKKMLEKVEALSEERDRLQNEKDDFK